MPKFKDLISFTEGAREWGLHPSTLRKALEYGKLKPNVDCKLFGRQWIISISAMERAFGPKPINAYELKRKIPIDDILSSSTNMHSAEEIAENESLYTLDK